MKLKSSQLKQIIREELSSVITHPTLTEAVIAKETEETDPIPGFGSTRTTLSLHDNGTVEATYENLTPDGRATGGDSTTMEWQEFLDLETAPWDDKLKELPFSPTESSDIKVDTWKKIIDAAKAHKGGDEEGEGPSTAAGKKAEKVMDTGAMNAFKDALEAANSKAAVKEILSKVFSQLGEKGQDYLKQALQDLAREL